MQAWLNEQQNYHGEAIGEGNLQDYGHFSKILFFIQWLSRAMRNYTKPGTRNSSVSMERHNEGWHGRSYGWEGSDVYRWQILAPRKCDGA